MLDAAEANAYLQFSLHHETRYLWSRLVLGLQLINGHTFKERTMTGPFRINKLGKSTGKKMVGIFDEVRFGSCSLCSAHVRNATDLERTRGSRYILWSYEHASTLVAFSLWQNIVLKLTAASQLVASKSRIDAAAEVSHAVNSGECGVSTDGTWQERGHLSLNECMSVISVDTGKVLNVEALSSSCKACKLKSKLCPTSAEFNEWNAKHTNCNANYTGNAGGCGTRWTLPHIREIRSYTEFKICWLLRKRWLKKPCNREGHLWQGQCESWNALDMCQSMLAAGCKSWRSEWLGWQEEEN